VKPTDQPKGLTVQIPGRSELMMRHGRRAAPSRGRVRLAVLAAILATSLAVSACGGAMIRSKSATILNTEKIERAIQRSAMAQRSEHAIVSCPSGVHQKQGVTFSCTATVGRSSTQFVVTQLDGSGDVHYAAR
jgi:hypothetical protein